MYRKQLWALETKEGEYAGWAHIDGASLEAGQIPAAFPSRESVRRTAREARSRCVYLKPVKVSVTVKKAA